MGRPLEAERQNEMAANFFERRPLPSFALSFGILFIIRMAFKWGDFKQDGIATVIGALVYAIGFALIMVLLPKFSKKRNQDL